MTAVRNRDRELPVSQAVQRTFAEYTEIAHSRPTNYRMAKRNSGFHIVGVDHDTHLAPKRYSLLEAIRIALTLLRRRVNG